MPYVPVNDIQLYYEEYGDGSPLFLVHGFTGSAAAWEKIIPMFASRYRVIVPDLRGHGHSSGDPETIRHSYFAADLVGLLDHLGIDQTHFVGHSSGGMCLLFIATEYQERIRTLTLVNATYTFDEVAKRHMRNVVADLPNQPEAIEALQQVHGPAHGDGYWQVLRRAFLAFTENPLELPFRPEDLSVITKPVLVMHGDRDPFFPVNIPVAMYQAMPNAELCIFPVTGHDIPVERQESFVETLLDFLARHAKGE